MTSTRNDPIDQLTYNILSEMGAKAGTPGEDIIPDSPTAPQPPRPSFTATPSSVFIGQSVSFNASASSDPEGTITDYKWDLDNSGKFATDTGTTTTLTHMFTTPGTYNVTLKVTDSKGQVETTRRTVNVANTATATLTAAMNPVGAGPDRHAQRGGLRLRQRHDHRLQVGSRRQRNI